MHTVLQQCPVCSEQLYVARLQCTNCETAVEGKFSLGSLAQLDDAQLRFVELFVRSEGKINRVCQELNLSYPVVRAQLTTVIEAMGFEADPPPPEVVSAEKRKEILARVANGEISAEEAINFLN